MENLDEIIEDFEKRFPDWEWLVRSDSEEGAFANVTKSRMRYVDEYVVGTTSFPTYGENAEEALSSAISAMMRSLID